MSRKEKRVGMTVREFWDSDRSIAIHCDTKEKAHELLKKFASLGKRWCSDKNYLLVDNWDEYGENTCYSNSRGYSEVCFYEEQDYEIVEFDELEDFKEGGGEMNDNE